MSLNKEKTIKNYKKFCTTGEKYGFLTNELTTFLGEDLIKAPASSNKSRYHAYEGGLLKHILTVTKYAVSINSILDEPSKIEESKLIKVCLLHQIGKCKLYTPKANVSLDQIYDYNNDLPTMRIGERSAYYCLSNGVSLTEDEYSAIINYDKDDDTMVKWYSNILTTVLKQANELAINEYKTKKQ